ncbi:MAG: hypothetical protein QOD61_1360 [Solirubrobacteraceae bacterium]|jgi:O-antigen ligase|nr:hypothetical protein [Solirubrobacteraceae bacterium]
MITRVSTGKTGGGRVELARAWPSWLAGIVALGLLVRMAWDGGGYFPPSYLSAGAIALLVLFGILVVRPPHYPLSLPALVGLAGLAGLTGWTALSSGWSPSADGALEAAQRDLAYLGLFGLALVAAGSGRHTRALVWGVLLAITVVCAAGLISRLYPDVLSVPAAQRFPGYRLAYPLGYWNAFGTLSGMGLVLALGLGADPAARALVRGLCAGLAVVFVVALYLSLSRGAWLGVIVGLVVLLALSDRRVSLLSTAGLVALVGGAALLRLRHYPALTTDPRLGAGQLSEGAAYGRQLIGLLLVAVAANLINAAGAAPLRERIPHLAPRLKLRLAAVAGLVLIALAIARAGAVGGFVDRQWTDFLRPSSTQTGTGRLLNAKGSRSDVYRVALGGFAAHPLIGDGAGSFAIRWIRERRVDETLQNAHSLELETLDELGLVGALLLAVFLGSILAAGVRSRVRAGALDATRTAAVTGAVAVWLLDSAVDWDWQMSAVTGLALVLAAALYPHGRWRRRVGGARGSGDAIGLSTCVGEGTSAAGRGAPTL